MWGVVFGKSCKFTDGVTPSVSVNALGFVIETHKSEYRNKVDAEED